MHILVTILQILGNVLLTLLVILLILLLLLLFVPVRYEAKGRYQEKKAVLRGTIRYLFPLFQLQFSYEQTKKLQLRIVGILVKDFFAPQSKKNRKKKKSKKKQVSNHDNHKGKNVKDAVETKQSISNEKRHELTDHGEDDDKQSMMDDNRIEQAVSGQDESGNRQMSEKQTIIRQIGKLAERLRVFWDSLCKCFDAFRKKVKEFMESANARKQQLLSFLAFWQREDVQKAIQISKKTLLKVLRSILPRKKYLHLHLGLGDPASTGQLCGFYGMIYPFVGNYVIIEPDFTQTVYEGDFYLKGKITLFVLLKAACIFAFHKDLKCIRKFVLHKEVANE